MNATAERRAAGAQRDKLTLKGRLRNYFGIHFHVLTQSLSQLGRAPLSTLMATTVIGIALALPALLYVSLSKIQSIGASWQESAQISLFLRDRVNEHGALSLQAELKRWPEISSVKYISREQALEQFRKNSGLGDVVAMLDENPLPAVLVVYPKLDENTTLDTEVLLSKLRARSEVELAQLDLEWVQRLHALIELANRAVTVLGVLLALAVLFVIGNTIRMAIQNRRDEIEVVKLIGGSDAFVRRPFLYNGIWYGLFGSLLAWLLVNTLLLLLDGPVRQLATLYGSDFSLGLVGIKTTLLLLLVGPLLGLVGAWLVAGRHIRAIEPS
jgi:cell division transport system permease protein